MAKLPPFTLSQALRWLLRALVVGTVPAAIAGYWFASSSRPTYAAYSALIGAIFSLVMWGGFDLTTPWLRRMCDHPDPMRAALISLGRWILIYTGLFLLCVGAVRVLVGINLFHQPANALLAAAMGLLISSIISGLHTTAHLVSTAQELEAQKARASFLALHAQLQPHTLFNALNTIAALIPEEPRRAEEAAERLSLLLRRIMGALDQERWTLGEEFGLLGQLLGLEALRFGGRLRYELVLPEDLRERPMPPLLLLPLVENSLKHGFRPKVGPCSLRVEASGGRITVRDDGVGAPGEPTEGVGLRTVRERLDAMGGHLRFPAVPEGHSVEVVLP